MTASWTTCSDCGDLTPEMDTVKGICITCWEGRAFTANAPRRQVELLDVFVAGVGLWVTALLVVVPALLAVLILLRLTARSRA